MRGQPWSRTRGGLLQATNGSGRYVEFDLVDLMCLLLDLPIAPVRPDKAGWLKTRGSHFHFLSLLLQNVFGVVSEVVGTWSV